MSQDQIPWLALIPVVLGRVSASVVGCAPYPFLPSMMRSFGLGPAKVSFWTGVAESAFMLVEGAVALPFSHLSDRIGRRPILILALLWLSVCCVGLGTASSVASVVAWRVTGGINAMRQVTKTMAADLSTDTTRLAIYSVMVPFICTGTLLGSLIGGAFAEPRDRIPVLGDVPMFQAYPYLLPCLVASLVPLFSLLMTFRFAKETKLNGPIFHKTNCDSHVLRGPGVLALLLAYTITHALDLGCHAATSLVANVDVEHGGLGLSLASTAWINGINGSMYMFVAPLLVRHLVKRRTKMEALLCLKLVWPMLPLAYMLTVYLARCHRELLPCGIALITVLRVCAGSCWALYDMIVVDISTPRTLSALNGYLVCFSSFGRAFGPFAFGSLFGLSTTFSTYSLGRQTVWVFMLLAAFIPLPLISRLAKREPVTPKDEETEPLLNTSR